MPPEEAEMRRRAAAFLDDKVEQDVGGAFEMQRTNDQADKDVDAAYTMHRLLN